MLRKERKTIRLKEYDYTNPNWYYVTVCTFNKKCLLGDINNGKMRLSTIGKTVEKYWKEIPRHYPFVDIDDYVIMPNHLHGIIIINYLKGNIKIVPKRKFSQPIRGSLSTIIGTLKSAVSREINLNRDPKITIWQSRFYDHIIRNENDLFNIRQYIYNNPLKWELDKYYSL